MRFDGLFMLAPPAGADSKTPCEHQAEQANGLVTTFESDLDDFEVGGGEKFAGFFEAKISLFFAKGDSEDFVKQAAEVARSAAGCAGDVGNPHVCQIGGRSAREEIFQTRARAVRAGWRWGIKCHVG